jgi:hypothetical protein
VVSPLVNLNLKTAEFRTVMLLSLMGILLSCEAYGAIIGDNNLREWYEVPSAKYQEAGRATAVLIKKSRNWLLHHEGQWGFSPEVPTFGDADSICSGEIFREQISPGDCSGFLVDKRHLVTAHHCIEPMGGCSDIQVVFDFFKASMTQVDFPLNPESVFQCRSVIHSNDIEDWAILELDRDVTGRDPLKFAALPNARGAVGSPVAILGYPRGLPLKIAAGANVREPSGLIDPEIAQDYFEADLDVFGGSSGAPVIHGTTGEVEGILVTGFGEFEDPQTDTVTGKECWSLRKMPLEDASLPWITKARSLPRF